MTKLNIFDQNHTILLGATASSNILFKKNKRNVRKMLF